jgi:hypothetical protein
MGITARPLWVFVNLGKDSNNCFQTKDHRTTTLVKTPSLAQH